MRGTPVQNPAWSTMVPDLADHEGELAPTTFLIAHDDYHARYVGTTSNGQQFFVTTPFTPAEEFVARYLFDREGHLREAEIVSLGARPGNGLLPGNTLAFKDQEKTEARLLEELGEVSFGDICIRPFAVTAHGIDFGMILNGPDPDDPNEEWYWSVTLEPGDFMSYSAPWDSGDYDT